MKRRSNGWTLVAIVATCVSGMACTEQRVHGSLTRDTVWTAEGGPYLVDDDVTVGADVVLRIGAGARVAFEEGRRLIVHGRLIAEGDEDRRILLTGSSGTSGGWGGLRFVNAPEESRLIHVDVERVSTDDAAVDVRRSRVVFDHVRWRDIDADLIELERPTVTIRGCEFLRIDGQLIHGKSLVGGGQLLIENNVFHESAGGDVIDFNRARRPGPVVRVLNNRFLGGQDEAVDLDGADGHIEGNTFTNFRAGPGTSGTANAIAASDGAEAFVKRNVFFGNDHALLVKNGAVLRVENNTIVGSIIAAVQLSEAGRDSRPGRGVYVDGTIFWDNAETFVGRSTDTALEVHRSIVPDEDVVLGEGNLGADPQFVGGTDFRLRPGSPAIGAGPGGRDMGAPPTSPKP